MSIHILQYFQQEWKRLHDEFEHFMKHGQLPASSPGASNSLTIADPAAPSNFLVPPPGAAPQQSPVTGVSPTTGSMGAGATDPNYVDPRFTNGVGNLTTDPSFDPYRRSVTDADFGKLFKTHAGNWTVSASVPNGAHFWLLEDGQETPGRQASVRLGDGPVYQCQFQGPMLDLPPGASTINITSNVPLSFELQPL